MKYLKEDKWFIISSVESKTVKLIVKESRIMLAGGLGVGNGAIPTKRYKLAVMK